MKKIVLLFLFWVGVLNNSQANINHIHFNKIPNSAKYAAEIAFVKDNQQYFAHWSHEWNYNKDKNQLIKGLQNSFTVLSSNPDKSTDLYLLLGDISHYLYNLDVAESHGVAISNYEAAIKSNPTDYRANWFLGNHLTKSNQLVAGIQNLLLAQKLAPGQAAADFWEDYAFAATVANMPSHANFAMDKIKQLTGKPGYFELQVGENLRKRLLESDPDKEYKKEDIWTAEVNEKVQFTNRPLGITFMVDTAWAIGLYDYAKKQSAITINPHDVTSKKGKRIGYSIAVLMRVAKDKEKLSDYLYTFVSDDKNKKKIPFSAKYENMIAYEVLDKSIYKEMGGGHMYIIGVERGVPAYPGLLLETPSDLPPTGSDQPSFYQGRETRNRFKNKIFYVVLLDSCEEIHEESLAVFKEFFENQLVLE